MTKICKDCGLEKPEDDFYTYTRYDREVPRKLHFAHCKLCNAKRSKKWKDLNPDKAKEHEKNHNARTAEIKRDWRLQKTYGLTLADFKVMLESQNGLCKICLLAPATDVDHCHDTGKIRGLLCGNCNRAIGLLQHSPILLQNAISYLSPSPSPSAWSCSSSS